MAMALKVEARAKVNFTLEVFGTRPDGYHELSSLVVPVSLSDTITVEKAAVTSVDTGYGERDLTVKAARALGVNAAIRITKRIPAGGGLGGGSADAAAVLRALNELYSLGHSPEALAEIGAKVGSDVPALVLGGMVMMEGRGERVEKVASRPPTTTPAASLGNLDLVLVNPGIGVETRAVFAEWDKTFDATCAVVGSQHSASSTTSPIVSAILRGDKSAIAAGFRNDLQEAALRVCPAIDEMLSSLRASGAIGVSMSGSGSTCFGLYENADAADRAADFLRLNMPTLAPHAPAPTVYRVCTALE